MSNAVESPDAISTEARRALLADRLRLAARRSHSSPLSFAQERLWFLDQLDPNSPRYNMPSVARLTGTLDLVALELALMPWWRGTKPCVHGSCATTGEPEQVIDENVSLQPRWLDLLHLDEAAREIEMKRLVHEEVRRPFNLAADRLAAGHRVASAAAGACPCLERSSHCF